MSGNITKTEEKFLQKVAANSIEGKLRYYCYKMSVKSEAYLQTKAEAERQCNNVIKARKRGLITSWEAFDLLVSIYRDADYVFYTLPDDVDEES